MFIMSSRSKSLESHMLKFFISLPILIVIIRQVEKFGHSSSIPPAHALRTAENFGHFWVVLPVLTSLNRYTKAAIFAMRLHENFGGEQELHLRLWCWESDGIWKM
jgi:hypothetical protein